MKKRILAFLLTLAMIVSMVPAAAFAVEPTVAAADFEGRTVSILGDSISTYGGVSNNTEYNPTIGNNEVFYENGLDKIYGAE